MLKRIIIFYSFFLCACPLYADTLYLKSGKVLEGKIIEKTDKYIKINVYDVNVTYFYDEISSVIKDEGQSGEQIVPQPVKTIEKPVKRGINVTQPLQDKKCFLWKVKSAQSSVYLLGSLHLTGKELYPLNKKIENAFDTSDFLVVEVNVNAADNLETQTLMLAKAMYPNNDALDNHLSKETYTLLKKKLDSLGLDIVEFSKFKPWYVAIKITILALLRLGYDPDLGLDSYFLSNVQGHKKILELESFDFQIQLFDSFSDKLQELFLVSSIIDLDILEKSMNTITSAWLSGDATAMENILFEGLQEQPALSPVYERIFYERNEKMASKIESYLKSAGNYFVVVGSGHLIGEHGIIRLLEHKGFTVEQL